MGKLFHTYICRNKIFLTLGFLRSIDDRIKVHLYYGLFTLPDSDSNSDSDSDSKPDGYILLCRNIHIGSDPDLDPCTDSFPNRYFTHFRDRYLSRGQMSIPIPYISTRASVRI